MRALVRVLVRVRAPVSVPVRASVVRMARQLVCVLKCSRAFVIVSVYVPALQVIGRPCVRPLKRLVPEHDCGGCAALAAKWMSSAASSNLPFRPLCLYCGTLVAWPGMRSW